MCDDRKASAAARQAARGGSRQERWACRGQVVGDERVFDIGWRIILVQDPYTGEWQQVPVAQARAAGLI